MTLFGYPLLAFLAAFNALLPASLLALHQQGFMDAAASGFGRSFIVWLSLFTCLALLVKAAKYLSLEQPTRRQIATKVSLTDTLCLLLLALALLVPVALFSWLICSLCCLVWLARSSTATKAARLRRAAALLLLSIAAREPITQVLLHSFSAEILGFDTWLSGLLLAGDEQFSLRGNTINHQDGFSLVILTGCSAFTDLSLALLLWLTAMLWLHQRLRWQDSYRIVLITLLILATNATRLALMATGEQLYRFLHDDFGAQLFDLLVLVWPLVNIRRYRKNHPIKTNTKAHKPNPRPAFKVQLAAPKLSLFSLFIGLLVAPYLRFSSQPNEAVVASERLALDIAWLSKIGEFKPTNQGDYLVEGFAHRQCRGSIALMPLLRNEEGLHMLANMAARVSPGTASTDSGVIYRGKLYPHYPKLAVLSADIESRFKQLLPVTLASGQVPTQRPLAYMEFGPCKLAQSIATTQLEPIERLKLPRNLQRFSF